MIEAELAESLVKEKDKCNHQSLGRWRLVITPPIVLSLTNCPSLEIVSSSETRDPVGNFLASSSLLKGKLGKTYLLVSGITMKCHLSTKLR